MSSTTQFRGDPPANRDTDRASEAGTVWKLMSLGISLAIVIFVSGAIALGILKFQQMQERRKPLPIIGQVSDFVLTERSGQTITLNDLKGRPWVAGFIFTRCTGPCPRISAEMARLQEELPARFRLVSFSVDPVYDTPEVLREYATRFHADSNRWLFLTGEKPKMYAFIVASFKLTVLEVLEENERIITHSTRLVLVDENAKIRAYYESTDPEDMKKLRRDVFRL
ncbi:MAG: SCO family protein [bacterium JZ-2024 1]